MAILPTRLLEIEFDAGVWTDVTADVVALETRRGRNRELGSFETGTLTFTLRNDTRKYDPDNTAGPFYGKLRPNRRVRFRATYNAVTYPVFIGYIDRITQQYGGPNDAAAEFAVSDLFKILQRVELPASAYAVEVAADTPSVWVRLDEPSSATAVYDTTRAVGLTRFGTPTLGNASLVTRDPNTAMAQTDATSGFRSALRGFVAAAALAPITFEAIIATTSTGGTIVSLISSPSIAAIQLYVSGSGKAQIILYDGFSSFTATSGVSVNDGSPHHLAGVWDGTQLRIYVDGTLGGTDSSATPTTFTATQELTIGNMGGGLGGSYAQGLPATIDEIAVYYSALSAPRIAAHAAARAAPWNGDLPGARLGRIFDLAAVPAGDRNIDAGTTPLQSTSLGGSALAYAQKVEETEIGWLFVTRDGKVRFLGRQAGFTGAYLTSLATLVDDDSGAGLPYRTVSADVDEATIIDRATVSRDGSVAVTYGDTAAQTEFKILDDTHDGLFHDDDGYSLYYAQWLVNTHKAPATRVGTLALALVGNPATMYPGILALELGDRVTYKRKPQNVGAMFTQDMRVESIAHETGGGYWTTRLQLSPFDLASGVPAGIWDTSLWDQAVWGL